MMCEELIANKLTLAMQTKIHEKAPAILEECIALNDDLLELIARIKTLEERTKDEVTKQELQKLKNYAKTLDSSIAKDLEEAQSVVRSKLLSLTFGRLDFGVIEILDLIKKESK